MIELKNQLKDQLKEIITQSEVIIPTIRISDWYQENMIFGQDSAFPGAMSYKLTPFWKEIVNKAHPLDSAKEISIMKGTQLGGTTAVLNPIIGYMMSLNPCNIMFLTGHTDLSLQAVRKIDEMIDRCNLRYLLQPSVKRKSNNLSGDTNKNKMFAGGNLIFGSVTNHKLLRQYDIKIMIVDDYDAARDSSKEAGSIRNLVQQRTAAYFNDKKIIYMSSPQLEINSNIKNVFLLGDQRYYNVPCPKCGDFIVLEWDIDVSDSTEKAGIFWKNDNHGRVQVNSVGYICQSCGNFFDESLKYEMNLSGTWIPTTEPIEQDHYSYHISSLYSAPGMNNWAHYAQLFMNSTPINGKRDEKSYQTFMNVVLGKTYTPSSFTIKATELQKNIRNYSIGSIPDNMSLEDGNGHIVLLTCACDLGGYPEDCRLDYEIVGWAENESSYSIIHGSIGTFIPRENLLKNKKDRKKWTYEFNRNNSIWPELTKILSQKFIVDDKRTLKIALTGIDNGFFTDYVNDYIDSSNLAIIGLKGEKENEFRKFGIDKPIFKLSKSRQGHYLLDVNAIKDSLADLMLLKWNSKYDDNQPKGFMNFPIPEKNIYLFETYFSHFEAEHRVFEDKKGKNSSFLWKKKNSVVQNHLFDCRIYNHAVKQILTYLIFKDMNKKDYSWKKLVKLFIK